MPCRKSFTVAGLPSTMNWKVSGARCSSCLSRAHACALIYDLLPATMSADRSRGVPARWLTRRCDQYPGGPIDGNISDPLVTVTLLSSSGVYMASNDTNTRALRTYDTPDGRSSWQKCQRKAEWARAPGCSLLANGTTTGSPTEPYIYDAARGYFASALGKRGLKGKASRRRRRR